MSAPAARLRATNDDLRDRSLANSGTGSRRETIARVAEGTGRQEPWGRPMSQHVTPLNGAKPLASHLVVDPASVAPGAAEQSSQDLRARGLAYLKADAFPEAIALLRHALALAPQDTQTQVNLGIALQVQNATPKPLPVSHSHRCRSRVTPCRSFTRPCHC